MEKEILENQITNEREKFPLDPQPHSITRWGEKMWTWEGVGGEFGEHIVAGVYRKYHSCPHAGPGDKVTIEKNNDDRWFWVIERGD